MCGAMRCAWLCIHSGKMYTSIIFTLCARHHKAILPNSKSQQNRKMSLCQDDDNDDDDDGGGDDGGVGDGDNNNDDDDVIPLTYCRS